MKTIYFTLLLIAVLQSPLLASNYFREVSVSTKSWEVTFHEEGPRYVVMIDSEQKGISEYRQRLRLLPKQRLKLIEKHSKMKVRPATRDGRMGVEITHVYRNPLTNEKKVKVIFEANHFVEDADTNDATTFEQGKTKQANSKSQK